jgi:hypothetical protein
MTRTMGLLWIGRGQQDKNSITPQPQVDPCSCGVTNTEQQSLYVHILIIGGTAWGGGNCSRSPIMKFTTD